MLCGWFLSYGVRAGVAEGGKDPWQVLNELYSVEEKSRAKKNRESTPAEDPWTRLRKIYLPFTEEEEEAGLADQEVGQKITDYLLKEVQPYAGIIQEAAHRFEVPPEIIAAVIMVESGGNTHAKAETSSASGLMQTISATFKEARAHLAEKGMMIGESPFAPRAAILAGTWYLDRMYTEAAKNHALTRAALGSWRYPLEYYYAGPGNGRKKEEIVIIYAGGRKFVVDKPAYSRKVLRWARIMREQSLRKRSFFHLLSGRQYSSPETAAGAPGNLHVIGQESWSEYQEKDNKAALRGAR